MALDPHEIASTLSDAAASGDHHSTALEALLSTLYTATIKGLEPAHGHSQSLFGPLDQILLQGKSIVPAPNAFENAGLTAPKVAESLSEEMQEWIQKGVNVVDPRSIMSYSESNLPGFQKTGHVLPELQVYETTEDSLRFQMASEIGLMKTVYQLPKAALVAVLVDFFLVTPGMDAYKEEIEDDPEGASADAISEIGIRAAVMAVISAATLAIFNK
jgi:hypothetical protein